MEEHKTQGMDEGAAWAVAWSRYCKYKNPESPRCQQETKDYFPGRQAMAERVARLHLGARGIPLAPRVRKLANAALIARGFGGRGRWPRMSAALAAMGEVLEDYGMEYADVVTADDMAGEAGRRDLGIAVTNPTDPFSPEPVTNSRLAVHWTQMSSGEFEVVAYLS